jgi:L-rhamnose mutarotase
VAAVSACGTIAPQAAYLAAQEVSARWQDAMADLLEEGVPDAGPAELPEVFRLD